MSGERGRGRSFGRGRSYDRDHDRRGRGRGDRFRPPSSQYSQGQGAWDHRPRPVEPQAGPSHAPCVRSSQVGQSVTREVVRTQEEVVPALAESVEEPSQPGPSRAAAPERGDVAEGASGGASGTAGATGSGRGVMRGRRQLLPEICTRPPSLITKKGDMGTPVSLQANYFKLLTTTNWCLYQYRVDFSPDEERTVVRKGLIKLHGDRLGPYVFDGTVIYSSQRNKNVEEFWSLRRSDGENVRITVRLVGELQRGDQQYIQFFNIIMRKCLDLLQLQLVGRDYFDAQGKVEVRDFMLELWPGYLTSIRQHETSILMCAEVTHKVMRKQTVFDVLSDCYSKGGANWKEMFEKIVIGLVVLTDYNNNTYRISDIDYDSNPSDTFTLKSGKVVTYREYYLEKYQLTIKTDQQPMLITRLKPRERRAGNAELVYLVPELCRVTGLSDEMRENFQLMRALAEHTRISPRARMAKLMNLNSRLAAIPAITAEFRRWNLELEERLISVPGRILSPEQIVLGRNRAVPAGQFADWTRELHDKTLFNPTKLCNWILICMGRMRREVERFVSTLQGSARGMGCRIENPRYWEINDDRSNTYSETLESIMSRCNPELIFCVVTNNRSDRYSAIKKKCIVDRPVPSQVFLARNLSSKGVRSIATKVAIQLTCKLGGAPWSVELPPINLMVVGFDVCHDPTDKSNDYGAIVASLDKSLTRYFSAVSSHSTGEELSNEFAVNMTKALLCYKKVNNCFPSHIVVYRDGVGEGQVPYVYEYEVEQVKLKLSEMYGDASAVKFAFIIVTKRINTRFFHNAENPAPGTVIDDVVTNPMRYDFFVISQNVRQGTVTPCSYNVISDTTGWKADNMQRLTYKLCHMYFNWSGTVRVPAPCQYAHKLAFMVAQYIRRSPSVHMETLLYYL